MQLLNVLMHVHKHFKLLQYLNDDLNIHSMMIYFLLLH